MIGDGASWPAWLAALASAAAIAAVRWFDVTVLHVLPVDVPGGRKRHGRALPMIGVVLGVLATLALAAGGRPSIAVGAGLCTLIGYLDDRRKARRGGLPLPAKILCLGAASWFAVASLRDEPLAPETWLFAVALAFVVINAVNFLDNAHGVAAAVGAVGLLLATGGHGPYAILAFLFLGFLPFNWPVPRLLLGDAGALCLGFCLCVTALERGTAGGSISLAAVLAPVAIFVLDFAQVVCARLWLGFAPWIADRRHLTHIAMNSGLPHVLVAPVFASLAAVLFVVLR